jgi:hypothetical protein
MAFGLSGRVDWFISAQYFSVVSRGSWQNHESSCVLSALRGLKSLYTLRPGRRV